MYCHCRKSMQPDDVDKQRDTKKSGQETAKKRDHPSDTHSKAERYQKQQCRITLLHEFPLSAKGPGKQAQHTLSEKEKQRDKEDQAERSAQSKYTQYRRAKPPRTCYSIRMSRLD